MSSYEARLGLPDQPRLPLGVTVDVTGTYIRLSAGGTKVAEWDLDDITVTQHAMRFLIIAEGEELIISVAEADAFAMELGLPRHPNRGRMGAAGRIR
jgi:hypothetical protein